MSSKPIKIIVIGPKESGKTLLCNSIADIVDNNTKYHPTEGVRILDVEIQLNSSSDNLVANIELWDCSGSQRYHSCWPAMQLDAQGIVFVYNPDIAEHSAELELLYDYFINQSGLSDACCFLLANQRTKLSLDVTFPEKFRGLMRKATNILTDMNEVKSYFTEFVEMLVNDLRSFNENRSSRLLF